MAAAVVASTAKAVVTAPTAVVDGLVPSAVRDSKAGQLVGTLTGWNADWDDDGNKQRILAKVPLLNRAAELDKGGTLLEELYSRMTERGFPAEQPLMTRGEPGLEMYFILEGELAVHLDLESPPVATLTEGDIVGEGALLSEDVRAAHVVAMVDTRVLVLTKQDLTDLLPRFPALGDEMKLFAEDRVRELLATAGAKMERFVQAREEQKQQLLTSARRLAARITITWFAVGWGLIGALWKVVICGVIDADASAEGSGSADEVAAFATPCVHAAQGAYQWTRPFVSVGPALFAITDWDIDAAAKNNPNKARLIITVYFWVFWGTMPLVHPFKACWLAYIAMLVWLYFIVFSAPIIRERNSAFSRGDPAHFLAHLQVGARLISVCQRSLASDF